MTSRMPVRLLMFALVSAVASGALAQTPSLGETARREQERRRTTPPATKVLTNADLPAVPARPPAEVAPTEPRDVPGTEAAEPAAAQAAGQAGTAADPPADKAAADETAWRARVTAVRQALQRNEVLVEALQSRVNGLSADFASRDDPAQRSRIGDDRQLALAELNRVRTEIAQLKQQLEDIEEEARRAGVPPGWLR